MNAAEFIEWESRKRNEADEIKDELVELARKSPAAKQFGRVLVACLDWELQRAMRTFLINGEDKKELLVFKKAIEVAQRLVNKAITEEQ